MEKGNHKYLGFHVSNGVEMVLEPGLRREFERFIIEKQITHPEAAAAQFIGDVRYGVAFSYSHGTFADLVEAARNIIKNVLAERKIQPT